MSRVYHSDLYGLRKAKYEALKRSHINSTDWQHIKPREPLYLFVPRDYALEAEYMRGWKITDAMPVHSVGIVTARDRLTIGWTREELWKRVQDFGRLEAEEARAKYSLGPDVRDWKVHLAQQDVRSTGPDRELVVRVLYRPFDVRFAYYTARTRGFICMPRPEVMPNFLEGENLGLIVTRQTREHWDGFCTRTIAGHKCMAAYDINTICPQYLYLRRGGKDDRLAATPWPRGKSGALSNLSHDFVSELDRRLRMDFVADGAGDLQDTFGPQDVFDYIYAVFYCPSYRQRYAEFLKSDFPRVPVTSDVALFRALCRLGAELVGLHLLESAKVHEHITSFPVPGDNQVAKRYPIYLAPGSKAPGVNEKLERGRVYMNKEQYFDGVPPEVWDFHVGGYQVCEKWLKDRRQRRLDIDELNHYQNVVVALNETIRLMADIDEVINAHGGWPIQ